MKLLQSALTLSVCVALYGCGGGDALYMEVAPARGKVTFNGQPVTDGSVMFTPVPSGEAEDRMTGKSASGELDSNGEFVLSTYEAQDGAIVGKHQVTVMANDPVKPLPGNLPENYEVEVTASGENTFEIQLQ
jgi:hypothetical protein